MRCYNDGKGDYFHYYIIFYAFSLKLTSYIPNRATIIREIQYGENKYGIGSEIYTFQRIYGFRRQAVALTNFAKQGARRNAEEAALFGIYKMICKSVLYPPIFYIYVYKFASVQPFFFVLLFAVPTDTICSSHNAFVFLEYFFVPIVKNALSVEKEHDRKFRDGS